LAVASAVACSEGGHGRPGEKSADTADTACSSHRVTTRFTPAFATVFAGARLRSELSLHRPRLALDVTPEAARARVERWLELSRTTHQRFDTLPASLFGVTHRVRYRRSLFVAVWLRRVWHAPTLPSCHVAMSASLLNGNGGADAGGEPPLPPPATIEATGRTIEATYCPVCGEEKKLASTLAPRAVAAATMAAGTPTVKRTLTRAGAIEGPAHRAIRCCRSCSTKGKNAADVAAHTYSDLAAVAPTTARDQNPLLNVPLLQTSDGRALVSCARSIIDISTAH